MDTPSTVIFRALSSKGCGASGVSTDYLLKDEIEQTEPGQLVASDSDLRTVSMEEASSFLKMREYIAPRIALGVMLCILSPILIILLSGAVETGLINISESRAVGMGLVLLFAMAGCAVALFVSSGLRAKPYEYLEKENIDTLYGVDGMVRDRRERFQPVFSRQLIIGIVLCVISVMPLFIGMVFAEEDSFIHIVSVGILLAMVAIGVFLIVRVGIIWGGFSQLLEEGDYSRSSKEDTRRLGWINGCYWMLVTAAFLAWSFITNSWDRSWIIWPVAGVAYGAIYAIFKAVRQKSA